VEAIKKIELKINNKKAEYFINVQHDETGSNKSSSSTCVT
jgi:hypothetical protein